MKNKKHLIDPVADYIIICRKIKNGLIDEMEKDAIVRSIKETFPHVTRKKQLQLNKLLATIEQITY